MPTPTYKEWVDYVQLIHPVHFVRIVLAFWQERTMSLKDRSDRFIDYLRGWIKPPDKKNDEPILTATAEKAFNESNTATSSTKENNRLHGHRVGQQNQHHWKVNNDIRYPRNMKMMKLRFIMRNATFDWFSIYDWSVLMLIVRWGHFVLASLKK